MNGIAIGPLLTLLLGGAVLAVCLVMGVRRRRGFMIVSCTLLLLGLMLSFALLPRAAYSRAVAERERAAAMQDQARHREYLIQQSIASKAARSAANTPHASHDDEDAEEMPDEDEREQADAAVAELRNRTDQAVDEVLKNAEKAVKELQGNVTATVDATAGDRRGSQNPDLPAMSVRTLHIEKPKRPSGLPDRSPRAQVVTGIMLAGVVLAGYFFLNANTRGHYTWRLRIGSTLVFLASLVVILLVTECL